MEVLSESDGCTVVRVEASFLLHAYLVVIHVLVVPVALQPVLRSVLLDKVIDSVPEVVGLQQQQLDYEVTNLSLVALVATHRLDEEERRSETHRSFHTVDIFSSLCKFLLTRQRMSLSRVTMLYFQTMSLSISMHLLSCCPPADVENS